VAKRNRAEIWVKRTGVALGIALVGAVVLAFRVPDGSGTLGADVIFSVSPTGELGVSPAGPFVNATGLRPGGELSGGFELVNQTGRPLAVRLRALPDSRDLDRLLHVELRAGNAKRPVFAGRLGLLRARTKPFRLTSGEKRRLRLRAWLPAGLKAGYAGRIESIGLELSSAVEGPA
jgi:hypothetical protein